VESHAARDQRAALAIGVVGTGYVGAVTATCLAWLGHDVIGLDLDPDRAGALAAGTPPIYEPGLAEMLAEARSLGRIRFTTSPAEALSGADVVFLCVGTPTGADGNPDLGQVASAARELARWMRDDVVVVNKSTVPVGSGNWVRAIIEQALPDERSPRFSVVSNPEFLREGCAITDFLHPDRIVLGGERSGLAVLRGMYAPILSQSFPGGDSDRRPELYETDLTSAEMIKYAANAFLATKISFANEIAGLCEHVGADVREVLPAIGADERIGQRFLAPGIGWGGSCFRKDAEALIAMASEYGALPPLLRAAIDVNDRQRSLAVHKLQRELKVLKGRRIAVLGLAFKPGTDDLRDAPALDVIRRLQASGALVRAYDPVVRGLAGDEFAEVAMAVDAYDAVRRADAVVVVTEWPEFAELDPAELAKSMDGGLLLDCRGCLPVDDFAAVGLRVVGFGWED
jgi:nucleotide sugar dehydrogenase